MQINKLVLLFLFSSILSLNIHSQTPDRVGWWKFDDTTNVLAAQSGFGLPLQLIGTHQLVQGYSQSDRAVKIGAGSHYKLRHQIQTNGGGSFVNEYSIQIDFKIESLGIWHCFFQTSIFNNNDGDCFINPNGNIGVGVTGYSTYAVKTNEWYRLILSIKNGTQYKYYLDGQLINNGATQSIDGRFALDSLLLMFADEDGEDGNIIVSEIGMWNRALTSTEVASLGGFGHQIGTVPGTQLILVPYLQSPSPNSIYICWHDTLANLTSVQYGESTSLDQSVSGTSEIISGNYRWHSVKLTGLQPNTLYYYKAISGSGESKIYSFRTLPDSTYKGKLRFLLLSDTHNNDTTMAVKVIKAAKQKIQQLYGSDIQNQITAVLHSGDLVVDGSNIKQWTDQYFAVMSIISPYIPFMTITGNHEGENLNYYKYMHYDEITPYTTAAERFWSFRAANTLFIGLNSNASSFFTLQKIWLDQILAQAQSDATIDFVYVMSHHFSITELWGEGMTYEKYKVDHVTNDIYPILKKYSKVVQHSYGHTHGYERGTIESLDTYPLGDFRIVCGGGGGGATDRWGAYVNNDFPNIHVTLDHYFFQIVEIDVENKTYECKMYSLGNSSRELNIEMLDSWYRKVNQEPPSEPITEQPTVESNQITLNCSAYSGNDSLMSVRLQISSDPNFVTMITDTIVNWKNIYGVDPSFNPIDLNAGMDLTKLTINSSKLFSGNQYYYRVKYRDHNTKWSPWSNATSFNNLVNVEETSVPIEFRLEQNFPNPFNPVTKIRWQSPVDGFQTLKIYDILGNEIATLAEGYKPAGKYEYDFNSNIDGHQLSSGVYFYKLSVKKSSGILGSESDYLSIKKLILIK
ncbi:MAG: fibronectin type III domain-containing protein [Ignavibacterium sp.]|nr:fibronectin type III domain-containing protein [Ignavibacterium sp.]